MSYTTPRHIPKYEILQKKKRLWTIPLIETTTNPIFQCFELHIALPEVFHAPPAGWLVHLLFTSENLLWLIYHFLIFPNSSEINSIGFFHWNPCNFQATTNCYWDLGARHCKYNIPRNAITKGIYNWRVRIFVNLCYISISWHKKLNVISRMDWLMGSRYFGEISFPRKKSPIYMDPLTRGYWSSEMDHRPIQ